MGDWVISHCDGGGLINEWTMPGNLSSSEVKAILQRLVCRDLTIDEILSASRRKNDKNRTTLLDQVGSGLPISYGENPHYNAERKNR